MDSGGSVNPTIAYMVVNNLNDKFYEYENFLTNIVIVHALHAQLFNIHVHKLSDLHLQ